MQTIKLEVEDSKLDIVLNIVENLKENIIKRYEIIGDSRGQKDFISLSEDSLKKIWDNEEDAEYDKFLKV